MIVSFREIPRFAYPLGNAMILEHLTTDLAQSVLLRGFILDGAVLHIIPLDIISEARQFVQHRKWI
jgi:hypothetical protein